MQETQMKTWAKAVIVAFALIATPWQTSAADKTSPPAPDTSGQENVAMVNGTPITKDAFEQTMKVAKQQFSRMGNPMDDAQLKEEVLNQLIGRELLYQQSQKAGIQVDQKMVDEQIAQMKKQFPTEDEFQKALKGMNLTEEKMRSNMEKGLALQKFITETYMKNATVPEKEIKEFYDIHPDMFKQPEQVKASHILIKVSPDAKQEEQDEALRKMKEVQEKQKKGEDFGELAKAYSECPSNSKGGDLGYFGRGQMVPAFEAAAFGMKPGETSDIVKTDYGYHLIKVTDSKPEGTIPYDQVKERLGQYLKQEKAQKEIKEAVDKLRKAAKVEVLLKTTP